MRFDDLADQPCSITRPLTVLGDRWTLLIVKQAFAGVRRFEDFHTSLGISRSRLTDRLDRLVEHGILVREPYRDGRTRYEYRLTRMGIELSPILVALMQWGDRWLSEDGAPTLLVHEACGTEVDLGFHCFTCERDFGPTERADLPFTVSDGADAVELLVQQGLLAAQQRVHAP